MAVKALVHLEFMKSRRNLDRTTGVTKKHFYQYGNPSGRQSFQRSHIDFDPFATDRGCLPGRKIRAVHLTTAPLLAPVQIQRYASLRPNCWVDRAGRSTWPNRLKRYFNADCNGNTGADLETRCHNATG